MQHQKRGRKFGLKRGPRKAFLRNLTQSLIRHERILTTEARAKELRRFVERLITHGKKQTLAALRLLTEKLPRVAAYKVYHELAPRYASRRGGYTRILKQTRVRKHDGSHMATIELV
ncbi:MAG: 50S ribosomal protein L17 [Candidatus Jorgensenbacteria bacterium]